MHKLAVEACGESDHYQGDGGAYPDGGVEPENAALRKPGGSGLFGRISDDEARENKENLYTNPTNAGIGNKVSKVRGRVPVRQVESENHKRRDEPNKVEPNKLAAPSSVHGGTRGDLCRTCTRVRHDGNLTQRQLTFYRASDGSSPKIQDVKHFAATTLSNIRNGT